MPFLPFHEIDPVHASEEALVLFRAGGPEPLSHGGWLLREEHCIDPTCACREVLLTARGFEGRITGVTVAPAQDAFERGGAVDWRFSVSPPCLAFRCDLERGRVEPRKGERPTEAERRVLREIGAGLGDAHLAVLDRHRELAHAWGKTNWWKHADWSMLRPGALVRWNQVFPLSEPWTLELQASTYVAFDQYCVNPACSCRDASLALVRRQGLNRVQLGLARASLETGRCTDLEPVRGRREELSQAAEALLRAEPVREELRRRQDFMREFGRFIAGRWPKCWEEPAPRSPIDATVRIGLPREAPARPRAGSRRLTAYERLRDETGEAFSAIADRTTQQERFDAARRLGLRLDTPLSGRGLESEALTEHLVFEVVLTDAVRAEIAIASLPPRLQEHVRANRDGAYSVYRVARVDPDEGTLTLEDCLRGGPKRTVVDVALSQTLPPHMDLLLGLRIIRADDLEMSSGLMVPVPPEDLPRLQKETAKRLEKGLDFRAAMARAWPGLFQRRHAMGVEFLIAE